MTRSAAARIAATADALLDWLHSQQRAVITGSPTPTPADAAAVTEAATGTDPAAAVDLPPAVRPRPDDRVRQPRTAIRRQNPATARAASLRLDHTDWLHHRLTITGPDAALTAFR